MGVPFQWSLSYQGEREYVNVRGVRRRAHSNTHCLCISPSLSLSPFVFVFTAKPTDTSVPAPPPVPEMPVAPPVPTAPVVPPQPNLSSSQSSSSSGGRESLLAAITDQKSRPKLRPPTKVPPAAAQPDASKNTAVGDLTAILGASLAAYRKHVQNEDDDEVTEDGEWAT